MSKNTQNIIITHSFRWEGYPDKHFSYFSYELHILVEKYEKNEYFRLKKCLIWGYDDFFYSVVNILFQILFSYFYLTLYKCEIVR